MAAGARRQAGTGWRNWAGNVSAQPARIRRPGSAAEVAAEVSAAARAGLRVRMAGTGHSFTGAAVTSGMLLLPDRLSGVLAIDQAAGLVTAQAGCPLRVLNAELAAAGLSLVNMGDIDVQTVAGAISTGTHGTGRDSASLAAQVAGLELVTADGAIRSVTAPPAPAGPVPRDPARADPAYPAAADPAPGDPVAGVSPGDLFDAARISLGTLGVLTAVTFRVVPAFLLRAREAPMRWSEVLARLDELTGENEHFEFFWFPHTEGCLTKRNDRSPGPARPLPRWRYWLDDEVLSNTVFGATCALGHQMPAAIPVVNSVASRALGARDYTDLACRVFTSPRRVRFTEQEYAVPRQALPEVLTELRALFRRRGWRVSFPIEVRVAPPDEIWLSTAYQRATGYVALHVYHRSAPDGYFTDTEALFASAGGRPHWGKLHTRDADYLRGVYPRFDDFNRLRRALDPGAVLGNDYADGVFGPRTAG